MTLKLITGSQIRAARALLGWSQQELADSSQVAINTIRRIEANGGTITGSATTFIKLVQTFTDSGLEFTGDGINSLGVSLTFNQK